jgi:hypothetical protein
MLDDPARHEVRLRALEPEPPDALAPVLGDDHYRTRCPFLVASFMLKTRTAYLRYLA